MPIESWEFYKNTVFLVKSLPKMNQPFPFLFLSLSSLLFSIILRNRLLKIESSTLSLFISYASFLDAKKMDEYGLQVDMIWRWASFVFLRIEEEALCAFVTVSHFETV